MFGAPVLRLRALERRVDALEDEREDLLRRLKRLQGRLDKGLADLRRDLESASETDDLAVEVEDLQDDEYEDDDPRRVPRKER